MAEKSLNVLCICMLWPSSKNRNSATQLVQQISARVENGANITVLAPYGGRESQKIWLDEYAPRPRKFISFSSKRIPLIDNIFSSLFFLNSKILSAVIRSEITKIGGLEQYKSRAQNLLGSKVVWRGQMPMSQVKQELGRSDCLVLPSRHDGWGAVVSEALQVGTPVICSNACGSSVVVQSSGYGRVFTSGQLNELIQVLKNQFAAGKVSLELRYEIIDWARCLGSRASADYLLNILNHRSNKNPRPIEPWHKASK